MCGFWNPPHRRRGRLSSSVTARWLTRRVGTHTCTARCAGSPSLRWTAFCRAVSALSTSLDGPGRYILSFLSPGFPYPPMVSVGFQAVVSSGKMAAVAAVDEDVMHQSVCMHRCSCSTCLPQRNNRQPALHSKGCLAPAPVANPDQTRVF